MAEGFLGLGYNSGLIPMGQVPSDVYPWLRTPADTFSDLADQVVDKDLFVALQRMMDQGDQQGMAYRNTVGGPLVPWAVRNLAEGTLNAPADFLDAYYRIAQGRGNLFDFLNVGTAGRGGGLLGAAAKPLKGLMPELASTIPTPVGGISGIISRRTVPLDVDGRLATVTTYTNQDYIDYLNNLFRKMKPEDAEELASLVQRKAAEAAPGETPFGFTVEGAKGIGDLLTQLAQGHGSIPKTLKRALEEADDPADEVLFRQLARNYDPNSALGRVQSIERLEKGASIEDLQAATANRASRVTAADPQNMQLGYVKQGVAKKDSDAAGQLFQKLKDAFALDTMKRELPTGKTLEDVAAENLNPGRLEEIRSAIRAEIGPDAPITYSDVIAHLTPRERESHFLMEDAINRLAQAPFNLAGTPNGATWRSLKGALGPEEIARNREAFKSQQKLLPPDQPGVYLYFDDGGNLLYSGRAWDVKKRAPGHWKYKHVDDPKRSWEDKEATLMDYVTALLMLPTRDYGVPAGFRG